MRREGGFIDIYRVKERIKCVGARSMKRAIKIVFVHIKGIGRLTYRNVRGQRASLCVARRDDLRARCIGAWG